MRFLGIGDYCDLADLYRRLVSEGHEVKISISEPMCRGTMAGLVPRIDNWADELPWIREAGKDGFVLFENVSYERGRQQDELRHQGYQVIGGSTFGDRLENDRSFGQAAVRSLSLPIAATHAFDSLKAASEFVGAHPNRFVLKFNGPEFGAADNYVGQMPDARDVLAVIAAKFGQCELDRMDFVLMEMSLASRWASAPTQWRTFPGAGMP